MNKKTVALAVWIAAVLLTVGGSMGHGVQEQAPKPVTLADCPNCTDFNPSLEGCTVIMVGKNASTDGSVMTTHTCDCGLCDWTFRRIPARDHQPGEMRRIFYSDQFGTWPPDLGLKWDRVPLDGFSGLEIPEIPHTYGYILGAFGYMNDKQVSIGESTIGNVEKMENNTPAPKFDITMLTLAAMERGGTAREAIQVMGSLAEKYGYGHTDSGEMLAVADPNEVWMFEVFPAGALWTPASGKPGAVWCAQRVPDDHVAVCPNESRIGEIDLDNKDYFMASPNVVSFAVDQKLYDPKSGKPFNWKRAYSPNDLSAASTHGSRVRLWRFFNLVAPSLNLGPETNNMDFPFSVKPEKKMSVQDVMNMTRDKCEGTIFDPARGLQGGPFANPNFIPYGFKLDGKTYNTPRIIDVNRAEYVTVTQARSGMPDPIGGIVWMAYGAQDTSCYMPLYNGITEIPRGFEIGDHWAFSREATRWAFDYVDYHTQVVYSYAIQDVRAAQKKYEVPVVERTPLIDKNALELYQKDPAAAIRYLTDYCLNNAAAVTDAWWKLGDSLLVKYNKLWIYDVKARKRNPLVFPDWYLRELVESNKLTPQKSAEH
ncbi:MAG: C69 family dipeptidase [Candidatus Aminicenantes bacterium]|nr:C69 family dipeptidase [Candidatus Aminicenantes bacterium]